MNTQALEIIPATSPVKPKPTKSEIVTALATLHIENLVQQNADIKARAAKLEKEIHRLMVATVKKDRLQNLTSSARTGHRWSEGISGVELRIDFPMSADSPLTKLLHEYHDCQKVPVPTMKESCNYIRARMENRASGEVRINQLLTDTETRKALTSALDMLEAA